MIGQSVTRYYKNQIVGYITNYDRTITYIIIYEKTVSYMIIYDRTVSYMIIYERTVSYVIIRELGFLQYAEFRRFFNFSAENHGIRQIFIAP